MIVIDASALVEALVVSPLGEAVLARLERSPDWHAPALIDLEVAQTLKRSAIRGDIAQSAASDLMADFEIFPIRRWDHRALLPRVWQLRHGMSAYDASYVALAESLDSPLITLDKRLASSTGHDVDIDLIVSS